MLIIAGSKRVNRLPHDVRVGLINRVMIRDVSNVILQAFVSQATTEDSQHSG